MYLCNYNLNATILSLSSAREIHSGSLYVSEKYGVEGFTIGGGTEYTVWFERKIGEKNFKYMTSIICRNSTWEHPLDCITFYAFGFRKKRIIRIGFHGKGWII